MNEIEVRTLRTGPHAGRSFLLDDGQPVLVEIHTRQSQTSPSRVKAVLGIPYSNGEDTTIIPVPFATPMFAPEGEQPCGMTPEFRLEMN